MKTSMDSIHGETREESGFERKTLQQTIPSLSVQLEVHGEHVILTVRMSRLGFTTVSWFCHCLSSSRSWSAQECKVRITLVHPNPGLKRVVHWTAAISLFFTNHLSSLWMVIRGCVGSWKSDVVVLCGSRWTHLQCTVSKKPLFCFSGDLVKFLKLHEHGRKIWMRARREREDGMDGLTRSLRPSL